MTLMARNFVLLVLLAEGGARFIETFQSVVVQLGSVNAPSAWEQVALFRVPENLARSQAPILEVESVHQGAPLWKL